MSAAVHGELFYSCEKCGQAKRTKVYETDALFYRNKRLCELCTRVETWNWSSARMWAMGGPIYCDMGLMNDDGTFRPRANTEFIESLLPRREPAREKRPRSFATFFRWALGLTPRL
jgi:hypothetical protein